MDLLHPAPAPRSGSAALQRQGFVASPLSVLLTGRAVSAVPVSVRHPSAVWFRAAPLYTPMNCNGQLLGIYLASYLSK